MNHDQLVSSAQALLDLDANGKLVPHGIGGLAREIIEGFIAEASTQSTGGSDGWREWTAFARLDLGDDTLIDVRDARGDYYPHQSYFNFKDNTGIVAWRRSATSPPGGSEAVGVKRPHKWVKSTLGHGEQMCEYCKGTNRELAGLGELDHCTAAPPEGIAARDAVIEEQVQAVVAAVRPYTVATLFIEELSDLVRAALRSPASSKDGDHA